MVSVDVKHHVYLLLNPAFLMFTPKLPAFFLVVIDSTALYLDLSKKFVTYGCLSFSVRSLLKAVGQILPLGQSELTPSAV